MLTPRPATTRAWHAAIAILAAGTSHAGADAPAENDAPSAPAERWAMQIFESNAPPDLESRLRALLPRRTALDDATPRLEIPPEAGIPLHDPDAPPPALDPFRPLRLSLELIVPPLPSPAWDVPNVADDPKPAALSERGAHTPDRNATSPPTLDLSTIQDQQLHTRSTAEPARGERAEGLALELVPGFALIGSGANQAIDDEYGYFAISAGADFRIGRRAGLQIGYDFFRHSGPSDRRAIEIEEEGLFARLQFRF